MKSNTVTVQHKNNPIPTLVAVNHHAVKTTRGKIGSVNRLKKRVIRLIRRGVVYLPIIFFWLTVFMVAVGQLSVTYPIDPESINLSLDKLGEIFQPIFRYACALTAIICLLQEAMAGFQQPSSGRD